MRDPSAQKEAATAPKKPRLFDFAAVSSSAPSSSPNASKPISIPFKLSNQVLSDSEIQRNLTGMELVQLSELEQKARLARRHWRLGRAALANFVTIGVVCHIWKKLIPPKVEGAQNSKNTTELDKTGSHVPSSTAVETSPQESSTNGSVVNNTQKPDRYMQVVRLSDLSRKSVCLALQPSLNVQPALRFGSVLMVLNPSFQNALDGDGFVLQVAKSGQLCVLGESSEIGVCKYQKPKTRPSTGIGASLPPLSAPLTSVDTHPNRELAQESRPKIESVCPSFINTTRADYCEYHMFEMVRESKSTRMVLNDAGGGALSSKARRQETADLAHHLSDGVYSLCDHKWSISERNVKLDRAGDRTSGPSDEQVYVLPQIFFASLGMPPSHSSNSCCPLTMLRFLIGSCTSRQLMLRCNTRIFSPPPSFSCIIRSAPPFGVSSTVL